MTGQLTLDFQAGSRDIRHAWHAVFRGRAPRRRGGPQVSVREVFVVEFPCGAFRVSRTREGAKEIGDQIAANQVCCERGHDSWEVWRFVSDRCTVGSRRARSACDAETTGARVACAEQAARRRCRATRSPETSFSVRVMREETTMQDEATDIEIATGLAHAPSPFLVRVLARLSRSEAATMLQAVQAWADETLTVKAKVTRVREKRGGHRQPELHDRHRGGAPRR